MRSKSQCSGKEVDIVTVGSGAEARIDDVVGARHAFNDVSREIGVWSIGRNVDGVTSGEGHEVHCARVVISG